jgi:hypothetical protein
MPMPTPRPTPAPGSDPLPIAPRHLWHRLTPDQRRPLLKTLVHVCGEIVGRETGRPGKERSDE